MAARPGQSATGAGAEAGAGAEPTSAPPSWYCAACGQPRRGDRGGRCPECGHRRITRQPPVSDARRTIGGIIGVVNVCLALLITGGTAWASISEGFDHLMFALIAGVLSGAAMLLGVAVLAFYERVVHRRITHPRLMAVLLLAWLSILVGNWPQRLAWPLHRPAFDALADAVAAGEPVPPTGTVGLYRYRDLDVLPNGSIGFWRSRYGTGFLRMQDADDPVDHINLWSVHRLSGRWRYVYED